ncbi:unnamed protein product [Wuchereria bancrofti]|uniref:Ground-like domain-containing protein n=1 Tax=Wuchereria bancrofti TaxID=6293 RepID=A0A3P7GFT6_WUCBA|nr:unnamed protein product [Wuchereria bancrofti]
MFHQLLIIIISYGLLQSVIHGRCIGDGCDKRQALKLLRFAPVNCHNQHHHTTVFCPNCAADKNIKSNNPPAPCSCPTAPTSNPQQFSRNSNIGIFKKNITLPLLPPGVPIIPSPQLDLLTAGGNVKFSNIQNLRLPTIKPPLVKKPLAQNMKRDPSRSKRAVQRAAEQKFSAHFNVICSKGDFSYVTHSIEYCEVSNRGTTCYAFRIR